MWGSILVATYATFETGVRNALSHWSRNVPSAEVFEIKGNGQFLKIAATYSEREIQTKLFPDEKLRKTVLELKAFRDSFAHSAGRMPLRRTKLHSAIEQAAKRGFAIVIEDGSWIASPRLAAHYLRCTERAYRLFSDAVMRECRSHAIPIGSNRVAACPSSIRGREACYFGSPSIRSATILRMISFEPPEMVQIHELR